MAISVSGICMVVLNMCSAALALCDIEDTVVTGHLRPLPECLQPPECRGFLLLCSAGQPHSVPRVIFFCCFRLRRCPGFLWSSELGGKSGWKGHYSAFQTHYILLPWSKLLQQALFLLPFLPLWELPRKKQVEDTARLPSPQTPHSPQL